jgi:hypothetical protein
MGSAASREHPRLTSIAPPIRPALSYFKPRAMRVPPGIPPETLEFNGDAGGFCNILVKHFSIPGPL